MRTTLLSGGTAAILLGLAAWAGWNGLSRRSQASDLERDAELRGLREELSSLRRGQEVMAVRLASAEAKLAERPSQPAEASLNSASAKRDDRDEARAAGDAADSNESPKSAERDRKLEECLARLTDPKASRGEREKAWARLARNGLLDDAVRYFEERASADPRIPDFHFDLGQAYLQKVFATAENEKGAWATKADRAFDAALALDDHHWGARFSKAASFSFWPPIFGKQPEAVKQFELLREQQEAQASRPEFAQTYVFLGNLYASQGNAAKASEVWRKGAEYFPDNSELATKAAPDVTK